MVQLSETVRKRAIAEGHTDWIDQLPDLVTKHRRGREQLVRSNRDTVRRAQHLLDELESLWLDRLDRFERLLETSTESDHP